MSEINFFVCLWEMPTCLFSLHLLCICRRLRIPTLSNISALMALSHCHKPFLLHKWPLLQVCYKPWNYAAKHAQLGYQCAFHEDQSLKVWWKKNQNCQSYSTFVETMYFLYSIGVVTFNKRWIILSVVIFFFHQTFRDWSLWKMH